MVTVPAATPVTMPVDPTVATDVVPEVHTPPPVPSLNVVVAPVQTVAVPVIVPALVVALTVTTVSAFILPQLLVTV